MNHHIFPTYSISMDPKRLKELQKNIWDEKPVPSIMEVEKRPYEIGIAYRGDHIRKFRKKSFRIEFGTHSHYFEGREIHLNAEYRDPSIMRSKLSFDFFQTTGTFSPDCKHVLLELNGKSKGIYLQLESVDEFFLQKRKLPDGPIFYATNYHANFSLLNPKCEPKKSLLSGYRRKIGNDQDALDLEMLIYKINTIPRSDFGGEIVKYLDVKKYLQWLCGVICTQNYDGFIHNYSLYRNTATGLYEIIPWDYDATWGRDVHGGIMEYNYVPIEGYNTLTARLLDIKDFRDQYRLLLEEILETSFTLAALEPKITGLYTQLRPYLTLDPYMKNAILKFDQEPEFIFRFIADRSSYLRNHLKDL